MAKQIIILNKSAGPAGDQLFNCAFWIAVPAGQQVPLPGFVSAFRGATAAELAALQAGTVVEQQYSTQYPATFTTAQIESALQTAYATASTTFGNQPNPNTLYGTFFDGTAWNAAGPLPSGIVSGRQYGSQTFNTTGDHTLIGGSAGQAVAIDQFQLSAAGAVTVLIKDGASTNLHGYIFPAGGGNAPPLPFTGLPWFLTSLGNGLVVNLSAAVNVIVSGWFRQA